MAKHETGEWWSEAKRLEVVTTWLVLGKIPLVSATTGVPAGTIRQWRTQPWWKELELSIQTENDTELDVKLQKRIDKALDLVMDRLENGDYLYDPKTGTFVRKPVNMKDTWKVSTEMIDKRLLLRKQPKEVQSQEAVGDILKNLAKEFADMARKKVKDGIEPSSQEPAELQIGVPELPREAGADPQPESPQSS